MVRIRMLNTLFRGFLCAGVTLSSSYASVSFMDVESVPQILGIGVGRGPDYRGSDDDVTPAGPFARYTLRGQQRFVKIIFSEASANLIDSAKLQAGPVLNYYFGRDTFSKSDVEDPVVRQMKSIDDTIEAGIHEYFATLATLIYLSKNWGVGAGVRVATLSEDAKSSPLVDIRGKSSYVISGVALGYMWW